MIRIIWIALLGFCSVTTQAQPDLEIRVNLGGYPANMPKSALILSNAALNQPVLLLKSVNETILNEYRGTPFGTAWHPFSQYYTTDSTYSFMPAPTRCASINSTIIWITSSLR